jgi:ribosomal protein S18 acetylase RimI-like enzyme
MNQNGMYHWNLHYPNEHIIQNDIDNNTLFLVRIKGICVGLMALDQHSTEEYEEISWGAPANKALTIHRLAVHPDHQNEGIGKQLIEFAESYAKEKGMESIRLDAFNGNQNAVQFYSGLGYDNRGEVFFNYQKTPFTCFEKKL